MTIAYSYLFLILCGFGAPVVYSQTNRPTAADRERTFWAELNLERKRRAEMRELESKPRPTIRPAHTSSEDRKIQKEAVAWIEARRKISPADLARYADFLTEKNTGIFKLFPDFDCVSRNVMRADGACIGLVAESSNYSFRKKDYEGNLFHEIGLNNGQLISDGFFSQGIMVSLGDIPIREVDASHPGLAFLTQFKPATTIADARKTELTLKQGIRRNGFIYISRVRAVENTTYALRVIAYRGHNAARDAKAALFYNPAARRGFSLIERNFYHASTDKRRDITVVFRIVRSDADGALTILWKKIESKSAPDIKFAKGEVPGDFKSN